MLTFYCEMNIAPWCLMWYTYPTLSQITERFNLSSLKSLQSTHFQYEDFGSDSWNACFDELQQSPGKNNLFAFKISIKKCIYFKDLKSKTNFRFKMELNLKWRYISEYLRLAQKKYFALALHFEQLLSILNQWILYRFKSEWFYEFISSLRSVFKFHLRLFLINSLPFTCRL